MWGRHEQPGAGPGKGCEDDYGLGAPDIGRGKVRAGAVPPGEEKAQWGFYQSM